ncbi:MAG: hypothetical protein AAGE65_00980 [Planctomycetota bacterium]
MLTRRFRVFAPAAALTLGAASLVGCTADRHTFSSTPLAPKGVDVTYIQSGETAWSYDIPAGQKLTLEFTRDGQFSGFKVPRTPATAMEWYISDLGTGDDISGHPGKFGAQDSGSIELTGAPIQINLRLLDVDTPDDTPAPIEVVPPPPPAIDDADEVPAPPPTVEEAPVEIPAPEPMIEDVVAPEADAVEEAVDAVEEAANELEK